MSSVIVDTAYGKVKGAKTGAVYVWKGIPYAKPPVGPLRFRAPEPPEAWEGVREATQFGPVAPQPSDQIMEFLGNKTDGASEDCLYLNIWSRGADDKRRPVMVWIHGGAFKCGSGSSAIYDGTSFADLGDVVVVTINYRLGVLGFLHLGELGGEEYASTGNNGILDQVAALKWVQENIAQFGGDPNRVTVFGESAGAMSVGALLAMPTAKGLFHQAILQSGAASFVKTSEEATKVAHIILNALDVSPDDLSKLKTLPLEGIVEAANLVPMMSLIPVVDGLYLPQHPEEAIVGGSAKDVTILIGTNKDEFSLFTAFDPRWKSTDNNEVLALFEQAFESRWPSISRHFLDNEELGRDLFDKLMTMLAFTAPAIKLAEAQIKCGTAVYMYRFDYESPTLKSCHALEIPFVWNSLDKTEVSIFNCGTHECQTIANQMHKAWIAFAHNENPNTEELPHWGKYNLENRATMVFGSESRLVNDSGSNDRIKWEKASVSHSSSV